jgi:tetratricopeptide (TPR) repeat protein
MQVPILDETAVDFAREFYRLWAAGEPIEAALAHARRLIRQQGPGAAADWSIPVLYSGLTPGLTLQPLQRVNRFLNPLLYTKRGFWAAIAVIGAVLTLLALPAALSTLRTEYWPIRCWLPEQMDPNKFTVAFYEFAVLDENGSHAWWDGGGRDMADFLYQQFSTLFGELDLPTPTELRPPAHTCAITGPTRLVRKEQAANKAGKINADVMIYGTVTDTGDQDWLNLAFHLSPPDAQQAGLTAGQPVPDSQPGNPFPFDKGEYLGFVDQHFLGDALPVRFPVDPNPQVFDEHSPPLVRMEIFSLLTIGLNYYEAGEVDKAIEYWQRAEQHEYWPESDGKEIIYLLLGNAYLQLAWSDRSGDEKLRLAKENLQTAVDIGTDYTRAQLSLANALWLDATRTSSRDDTEPLRVVEEAYQSLLQSSNRQDDPVTSLKADLGLGRTYAVWAYFSPDPAGYRQLARQSFEEVTKEYEHRLETCDSAGDTCQGELARLANVAATAYQQLGYMAKVEGDVQRGIEMYSQAVRWAHPITQVKYSAWLGDLHCLDGDQESAREAYEWAIYRAREYLKGKDVDALYRDLEDLDCS